MTSLQIAISDTAIIDRGRNVVCKSTPFVFITNTRTYTQVGNALLTEIPPWTSIASSNDGTVKLWEVASGTTIRTLSQHEARVNAIALDSWESTVETSLALGKDSRRELVASI